MSIYIIEDRQVRIKLLEHLKVADVHMYSLIGNLPLHKVLTTHELWFVKTSILESIL